MESVEGSAESVSVLLTSYSLLQEKSNVGIQTQKRESEQFENSHVKKIAKPA